MFLLLLLDIVDAVYRRVISAVSDDGDDDDDCDCDDGFDQAGVSHVIPLFCSLDDLIYMQYVYHTKRGTEPPCQRDRPQDMGGATRALRGI